MRAWPHHRDRDWKALTEGDHIVNGHSYRLRGVDCGELFVPSGRLAVCDPFAGMRRGGNPAVQVPPGCHRVHVTLADVGGVTGNRQHGSYLCAYASLLLSSVPEARRELLMPALSVNSGTACFVDDEALIQGMPPEEDWYLNLFDTGRRGSWLAVKEDSGHIREGIANLFLPLGWDGSNLILFSAGWGDGVYPIVGGYDAEDRLVAVHVDFLVIPRCEERDAVRNWIRPAVPWERRQARV
jgi:Protein of unknown function (DUF4241)